MKKYLVIDAVHIAEWRKRKAERSTEGRSKNNVD